MLAGVFPPVWFRRQASASLSQRASSGGAQSCPFHEVVIVLGKYYTGGVVVSVREFRMAVSRCDFLLDYQKERLMGMLDGVGGSDETDWYHDGRVRMATVLPVIDNVLWRTLGTGLRSLPVGDQQTIERAVREVAY